MGASEAVFMGFGDKSLILSPFSPIIKGVREKIRVVYICRNGNKTGLFVPESHGCWPFRAFPFVPPWGRSPASLFLYVPPKARCHAVSGHLSPVVYGRGQNGDAGTNLRGQNGDMRDDLWHPSSFPYLPKLDAVRLPGICPLSCKAGDKMGVRGQI